VCDQIKDKLPDYYKILNISRNVSTDEILTAYREVSKKFQNNTNVPDSVRVHQENEFALCLEAFRTLTSPENKIKYDLLLSESEKQSQIDLNNQETKKEEEKVSNLKMSLYEIKFDMKQIKEKQNKREKELFLKAKVQMEAKLYHEAIDLFRKLIELNPKESAYHSYLGMVLKEKGWNGYAQAEFKVALYYNPNDLIAIKHYEGNKDSISQRKLTSKEESKKGLLGKVVEIYTKLRPKSQKS
jgi:curved DNA-binding protein CbpA